MGLVGTAFGLGFIFGPAIGGVLSHLGPSAPMWFASTLCFANLLAAWRLLPESRHRAKHVEGLGRADLLRRAVARPRLAWLLSLYFIITASFSGFEATFALFSERRFGFTTSTIGYVFAFIGAVLAVVQGVLVGRVVRWVGEARLIPAAILAMGVGIGLVPFAWTVPTLLVAVGLIAAGMGFNNPALSSTVSRLTPPDDQGSILGLASSLASLGRVIGPAWGGLLFDQYGMTVPYVCAAGIMLGAAVVALAAIGR
jgi:predicted MFS family arabinose efflux permease